MTIALAHLTYEIWTHFMNAPQVTMERILLLAEKVIPSNGNCMFENNFYVNFIHTPTPGGAGRNKCIASLDKYFTIKKIYYQN